MAEKEKTTLIPVQGALKEMTLGNVEARVGTLTQKTAREFEHTLMEAERYIVRNPWRAVGIAAGAGLILGSLLALRPRQD